MSKEANEQFFLRVGKAISNNIDAPNFEIFHTVDISVKTQSLDQTDSRGKYLFR